MTEPPLSLSAYAARHQQQQLQQQQQLLQHQQQQHHHSPSQHTPSATSAPPIRYAPRMTDPAGLDGSVEQEDDGEIICICAYNWDDGYTIQCETCQKWNHMECYYPNEADRPGDNQTHYCVDCQPREVDDRRATALQREKYHEQLRDNGPKRPVSKAGRKKTKDTAPVNAAVNGWSADKHAHLHGRERKSASPRDQPPPAKRPKTTHRSSAATGTAAGGRKRNGSTLNNPQRSQSKSPGAERSYGPVIPMCSEEFLHLLDALPSHTNTDTNIWNSIEVTKSSSDWLMNPEAVERDCQLKQTDVFKRWDGPFELMPGKPEVSSQTRVDSKFLGNGAAVKYPCLTVEQDITQHTFIGELLGHVGFKQEYMEEENGRWESLRHCEPFVFFHPKLPVYIDARQEGSIYRYVRRSCQPNAEMQTIISDGTTYHFCFMATKDIMPGEEITVGWEFDERIRAMYAQKADGGHSGWAPDVRDQIAMWVSNVLANCGPCACSSPGCPMAFFDRRGQAIPIDIRPAPIKAPKTRKRKTVHNLSPDESARNSNSRSGSEVRKVEQQDEDMTDSRSVSGSYRGSASRDMTPNTQQFAVVPELSERERKKLMREEEMFKKQEEEKGRQRNKKRNSGGSNLNTPSASTSRQLGHPATSTSAPKYADAATSSRGPTASGRSSTVRRGGRSAQSSRNANKSSAMQPPRPPYVDSAIQCDMDRDEAVALPFVTPPKRKQYLTTTQRLLRRCASNNFKRKAESLEQEERKTTPILQGDSMDIDKEESPRPDADTADVLPLSPVSDKVKDADTVDDAPQTVEPPAFTSLDTDMKDLTATDTDNATATSSVNADVNAHAEMEADADADADADEDYEPEPAKTPPPPLRVQLSIDDASPRLEHARITSNPLMDPPPPPWPSRSPLSSPNSSRDIAQDRSKQSTKPDFHVTMPAASVNSFASSVAHTIVQTPLAITPTLAPNHVLAPTAAASLNPSPIARKKMSLSDYTKRAKAQVPPGSSGHRESSPATSVVSTDLGPVREKDRERDGLLQGSAVSDSPAPESIPASSAEEKRPDVIVGKPNGEDQDEEEEGEVFSASGSASASAPVSAAVEKVPSAVETLSQPAAGTAAAPTDPNGPASAPIPAAAIVS